MTFICNGSPEYGWTKKVKGMKPHDFIQWFNRCPALRQAMSKARYPGDDETDISQINQANFPEQSRFHDGLLMDGDELEAWADAGIKVEVSRIKGLASNARELQSTIFQVSVANVGLMQVQCVEVIEDACTDEIQRWLDKGWRIIAVCPPNDSRRPSYIMGHFDKEPHR